MPNAAVLGGEDGDGCLTTEVDSSLSSWDAVISRSVLGVVRSVRVLNSEVFRIVGVNISFIVSERTVVLNSEVVARKAAVVSVRVDLATVVLKGKVATGVVEEVPGVLKAAPRVDCDGEVGLR